MSQIIHALDKNNSGKKRKRATIAICSSTPIGTSVPKHGNISLSEIDTGSSSSGGKITRRVQLQLQAAASERKRYTKGKKRLDTKWKIKDADSEWEAKQKELKKRKKNLKSKKKKKQMIHSKDTDSEWETELEKSVNEFSMNSQISTLKDDECIKLFSDPCTPEKIRAAPTMYGEILSESPTIESFRKKSDLISNKNDIALQNELLPVNLLSSEIRNPEESSEDEIMFDNKSRGETYTLQKPEKSSIQKSENFFDLEFPTTEFYRDKPIKTYSRKTSQHLALSFKLSPIKFMSSRRRLSNAFRKTESSIPPEMICISEYRYKNDKKWKTYKDNSSQEEFENVMTYVSQYRNEKKRKFGKNSSKEDFEIGERKTKTRKKNTKNPKRKMIVSRFTSKQKYDVYDRYDETDTEFETGGRDGKRMSFREYCKTKGDRNH